MTKKLSLSGIDHIVLTVKNIEESIRFYAQQLGCTVSVLGVTGLPCKSDHQKLTSINPINRSNSTRLSPPVAALTFVC